MGIRKAIKKEVAGHKRALEIPTINEWTEGFDAALEVTISGLESILKANPKEKK